MIKNTWENLFLFLLYCFCIAVAIIVIAACFSKKFTRQYSLGGDTNSLTITKEIDWAEDRQITLDRSVTYWEAIRMVDSLNKTLK